MVQLKVIVYFLLSFQTLKLLLLLLLLFLLYPNGISWICVGRKSLALYSLLLVIYSSVARECLHYGFCLPRLIFNNCHCFGIQPKRSFTINILLQKRAFDKFNSLQSLMTPAKEKKIISFQINFTFSFVCLFLPALTLFFSWLWWKNTEWFDFTT